MSRTDKRNDSRGAMPREGRYQLAGWLLFVACALVFIAAGLKNRDILTVIGGLLFLVACIVFLVPIVELSGKEKRPGR